GFAYQSTVSMATGQHAEVPDVATLYTAIVEALEEAYQSERDRGVTLIGPHRDDLVITLGPAPAKGFASHGETWSLALALRLASSISPRYLWLPASTRKYPMWQLYIPLSWKPLKRRINPNETGALP